MSLLDRFQVVLMPRREVLAAGLTLAEAVAYLGGYAEANDDGEQQAVIALPHPPALAASGRRLRQAAAGRQRPPAAPSGGGACGKAVRITPLGMNGRIGRSGRGRRERRSDDSVLSSLLRNAVVELCGYAPRANQRGARLPINLPAALPL